MYPRFDRPFMLYSDASMECMGGMLSQEDDDGILHPIAYYSRKLSRTEQAYPVHEQEALAPLCCLEHWVSLTKHSDVKCYTDNMSCKAIFANTKQPLLRRARFAVRMGQFDSVTINHVKGKYNQAADCLSRLAVSESESDEQESRENEDGRLDTEAIRTKGVKIERKRSESAAETMHRTARNHNNLIAELKAYSNQPYYGDTWESVIEDNEQQQPDQRQHDTICANIFNLSEDERDAEPLPAEAENPTQDATTK